MSEIIGIISEYNPFHNGHRYQIEQARARFGNDAAVVCAMSGNFVQRGEPAIVSKFARAEAACRCGVDLAAELPLPWALSSAEGFALGGVSVLTRFGITVLCFGAETEDLALLQSLVEAADAPDFIGSVKDRLSRQPELSFAEARALCLRERLGNEAAVEAEKPNNILAVEYLRALKKLAPAVRPCPVPRTGCGHDEAGLGNVTSASDIRSRIQRDEAWENFLPLASEALLKKEFNAGRGPVDFTSLDNALLSRLRQLGPEDFAVCTENRGGLAERLHAAVRSEASVEDVCRAAKTGRYAMSAVKRSLLRACLGLRADAPAAALPPYARILAFNEKGRILLHRLDEGAGIVTKPASVRSMDAEARSVFTLNASADDLYCLAFTAPEDRKCGNDWRKGPVIVD